MTDHTITIPALDQYGHVSGEEVAKLFMRFVNSMSHDVIEFVEVVTNDHRTLQQSATSVFLTAILVMAENADAGRTDPRNEASASFCQKVRDLMVNEGVFTDRQNVIRFPFV